MRISIIIPTYGRPERLERATRSLLAQRRPPDELVIVVKSWDVASRTAAERLCCAGSGMAVRIATVEEASIIAAENAGMRAATGDVVCFMDDDAVAPPDWVEQITAYYADPRVGGVGGR
ncbi:MAG: glycosyltransferase family 2 protein, partial [Chloroflexi bacterium]|nr:glycosyltransferase family 2 protein [Chloroflexota bacterium]